jgi:hypothetical protein
LDGDSMSTMTRSSATIAFDWPAAGPVVVMTSLSFGDQPPVESTATRIPAAREGSMRERYRLWTRPVVIGSGQRMIRDDAARKSTPERPAASGQDAARDSQARDALAMLLLGVLADDTSHEPTSDDPPASAAPC